METHIVIMTGGTRNCFAPISSSENPYQFMNVSERGKSLVQMKVEHFQGLCTPDNIWIVTSEKCTDIVRKQLPSVPSNHILEESVARNTTPCIVYACWKIKKRHPDANIVVTPADTLATNINEFRRVIAKALLITYQSNAIVTIGIKPYRPETGYGYIKAGERIDQELWIVNEFKEKLGCHATQQYVDAGNYWGNTGIFIWNVQTIEKAIRRYAPGIAEVFDKIYPEFYTEKEKETLERLFPTCESISIGHAVMEKAERIYVLPSKY